MEKSVGVQRGTSMEGGTEGLGGECFFGKVFMGVDGAVDIHVCVCGTTGEALAWTQIFH